MEKAATGGEDGQRIPVGSKWHAKAEPWRANTFESRLGQTTAVGMYPAEPRRAERSTWQARSGSGA